MLIWCSGNIFKNSVFLWKQTLFSRFLIILVGIERHIYLKHNIVNVFTDTFDQFNASLLNKILINFFNYLFIYYKIIIINIVKNLITIRYFSK